jgi:hypothetical protein
MVLLRPIECTAVTGQLKSPYLPPKPNGPSKNHLGDRNEFLPTVHGFDQFDGNLYHLNSEEEPEDPDYPKDPAFAAKFGPRGVLHQSA